MKRILSRKTLYEYAAEHADAKDPLDTWYTVVKEADWATPQDVKETFRSASIIGDNRVVFNIKGNDYRLIAYINHGFRTVYIKWFGTHSEYDRIDAVEVGWGDN